MNRYLVRKFLFAKEHFCEIISEWLEGTIVKKLKMHHGEKYVLLVACTHLPSGVLSLLESASSASSSISFCLDWNFLDLLPRLWVVVLLELSSEMIRTQLQESWLGSFVPS